MSGEHEVVDLDGGDVLGVFDSLDAAFASASALIEEQPDLSADIAVVTMTQAGLTYYMAKR